MSPSWRDRVSIFSPRDEVHLARHARGWRPAPGIAHSVECGVAAADAWAAALEALSARARAARVAGRGRAGRRFEPLRALRAGACGRQAARRERAHGGRAHTRCARPTASAATTGGWCSATCRGGDATRGGDRTRARRRRSRRRSRPRSCGRWRSSRFSPPRSTRCRASIDREPVWLAAAEPGRALRRPISTHGAWRQVRNERLRGAPRGRARPRARALPALRPAPRRRPGACSWSPASMRTLAPAAAPGWSLERVRLAGRRRCTPLAA